MKTSFIGVGGWAIADLIYLRKDTYVLTRIYVRDKFRRQGFGTELLRAVLDEADLHGATLVLEIAPPDKMGYHDLKKWYERFGFVSVKVTTPYGKGFGMQRLPRAS